MWFWRGTALLDENHFVFSCKVLDDPFVSGVLKWLFITSGVGAKVGSGFEKQLDKKYIPNWKINYMFETKYVPTPIQVSPEKSYVPSVIGNFSDNISSPFVEWRLKEYLGGRNESK